MTTRPTASVYPDVELPDLPGAACARPGVNPSLFFPRQHKGAVGAAEAAARAADLATARAVCDTCPLPTRRACLDWAVDNREAGIWSGTTEQMRTWLRRQRDAERAAS